MRMAAGLNKAFTILAYSDHTKCSLRSIDVILRGTTNSTADLATTANNLYNQQKPAFRVRTSELWEKLVGLATENASTEAFLVKLLWPMGSDCKFLRRVIRACGDS